MPVAAIPNLRQRGASLLEALIGILIFSTGILALVGMQALAIKHVSDAKYRADASFLANKIIGQIWVDRANLANYAYPGGGAPALANWVLDVQNELPGVAANPPSVQPGVPVPNAVTVTVSWQPPGSATPHNYMTVAYIIGP